MPGKQQFAWVTTAFNEDTAIQAAVLGKSLARVITMADTIVLVSKTLDQNLRQILANYFDCVIRVDLEEKHFNENWMTVDLLKLFAVSLEMYTKIVIMDSDHLILQNCDDVFQLEKNYYTAKMPVNQKSILPPIFVVTPDCSLYDEIIKVGNTRQLCLTSVFTDACELFGKDALGELQKEYYADITDLLNTLPKIISKALFMTMTTQSNFSVKKINDFHASICSEFRQHQLENTEKVQTWSKEPKSKHWTHYKDAIAIVGHSCRFPASNNIDEFWDLLIKGGDGIGPYPLERLKLGEENQSQFKAGFLNQHIDEFDAKFFGISPREAELIDPQQRMLLEVAWEALENAAINPHSLRGSNTGVFTGVWQADYEKIVKENTTVKAFHNIILGNSFSATSSRISYVLGLNGPNIATESGCSSSMIAVHLACESLKRKEMDVGLVMGANLIIRKDFIEMETPILAKDGHCKTFDEKADGFGRAEGIAVIVVKRLSDAIANGDRVMGIIRGSAMSNEGTSSSFGTPSRLCQEIAVRGALANSGVRPEDVDYVEAHGTGTPVGDPIEFSALAAGYAGKREKPLIIGSVKTNIGHSESAAGLAGLIKVILAMKHEVIPPHRNFESLNPYINLETIPAMLPLESQPWKRNPDRVRIAGVSSFGISGTNVHVILEEPTPEDKHCPIVINSLETNRAHYVLNLSAKTENALDALVNSYIEYFKQNPGADISDLTYTANTGRAHFNCRLSVTGKDMSELSTALQHRNTVGLMKEAPKIAFLFTGQGSQYFGMAQDLYKSNYIFRNSFDNCAMIVKNKTGIILNDVLWNSRNSDLQLKQCVAGQVSIFCVEYSLLKLLWSLGINPDYVLGHSVGEYAAAVAAGIIDLRSALDLLIARSQLIAELPAGGMIAVMCSKEMGDELISKYSKEYKNHWVDIAVVNSSEEIVVAGRIESLEKFQLLCQNNNVRFKVLSASQAFHSRDINDIITRFQKITNTMKYKNPICHYISGTTGSLLEIDEMGDGKYWLRHARDSVNFQRGMQTLAENGCNTFIEVGPRPILLAIGLESLKNSMDNSLWLPTIQQNKNNWGTLLDSLGKLYVSGVNIDWSEIEMSEKRKKLELPTYPFQRQKYWINIPDNNETKLVHPLLGRKVSLVSKKETVYTNYLNLDEFFYLMDHKVANLIIMPGAGFLEIILAAGNDLLKVGNHSESILSVKNFVIEAAFELEEGKKYETQVIATPAEPNKNDSFVIGVYVYSYQNGWKKHSEAIVSLLLKESSDIMFANENIENFKSRCNCQEVSSNEFYKEIQRVGIYFGETFQSIETFSTLENETLAKVRLDESINNLKDYIFHPIILDAMLQAISMTGDKKDDGSLYLPIGIENCITFGIKPDNVVYAHARWDVKETKGIVTLCNGNNDLLCIMSGVRFIRTTIGYFLNSMSGQKNTLPTLYQEIWRSRLGPLQNRVDGRNLPKFSEVIIPLDRSMENDMKLYDPKIMMLLDEFICLNVIRSFSNAGIHLTLGKQYNTNTIMLDNLISRKYSKLLERMIDLFVEDGYVVRLNSLSDWKVIKPILVGRDIESHLADLHDSISVSIPVDLHLGETCSDNFWDVVTGKLDPVASLFGRTDINITDIYTKGLTTVLANKRIAKFLGLTFDNLKAKKVGNETEIVRVIEIGGGSAASSKEILKVFQEKGIGCHYTFTDISAQFFDNARKELSAFQMVDYKVLDIEKDPYTQGFCPGYYDVVVAANVIHATESLKTSIRNCRQLLVDGGILVLEELLRPWRVVDVIFGRLDGYWKFNDHDLRTSSPMVSKTIWDQVLTDSSFGVSCLLSQEDEQISVLVTNAVSANLPIRGNDLTVKANNSSKMWIIFCDNGSLHKVIAERLSSICPNIIFLTHSTEDQRHIKSVEYSINMLDEIQFENKLLEITQSKEICGVTNLMPLDYKGKIDDYELYTKVFNFCKYFAKHTANNAKIVVVTRGAVFTTNQETVLPSGAVIWGMIKSLVNETSKMSITLVDMDPEDEDEAKISSKIFFEAFNSTEEKLVCYRKEKKFVPKMIKYKEQSEPLHLPKGGYKIQLPKTKRISDLSFKQHKKCALEPLDVEVIIRAMSLNFRDIFVILKPDGFRSLFDDIGSDFAGIVSKIGTNVTKFKIGDEVFGFGMGTAANYIVLKENHAIFHKPIHFNLYEAVTIPSCYLTAQYCLVNVADLKKNETVLIHVASGGVGLYAIQIAQCIGAKIIATAGSHRKRSYLRSIGLEHVFHSRDVTFGDGIKKVTNGCGVDVVLNSLTSEGFKETTLDNCAKNARFVEIGKVNIWQADDVQKLRTDVEYTIVDLEKCDPKLLEDSMANVYRKEIKPVAYCMFDITNIRNALNHFMKAQHIGKVVISIPDNQQIGGEIKTNEIVFHQNATYLITGGLGGIGLVVAEWMANLGAGCLVLISRSSSNAETLVTINRLRGLGCRVLTFATDVGNFEQCQRLFESIASDNLQLPPLKGVIHSAGVLSDGMLANQSWENYKTVFNAKVQGCLNLHNLTKYIQLDHFVLFSSMAAVVAPLGQSNHCAANSFLDAFAHCRHSVGLPAQTINWGAWAEVGAAVDLKFFGVYPFTPKQGLAALQYVMSRPNLTQLGVIQFDFKEISNLNETLSNYFEESLEENAKAGGLSNTVRSEKFWEEMKPMNVNDRESYIKKLLTDLIKETLKLPKGEQVNEEQAFSDMGLDSLMAVELKNKIQNIMGDNLVLSAATLIDYSTIGTLGQHLAEGTMTNVSTISEAKAFSVDVKELIKKDSILPDDIRGNGNFPKASEVHKVLLIGGTGHLGSHILEQLLSNHSLSIICLVRSSTQKLASKKIIRSLKKYNLSIDVERISVIKGDITQERFGLSTADYSQLSESIDAVYHLAAKVNFTEDYKMAQNSNMTDIRSVNVLGTINVLRFAGNIKTKRVFYSSSIVAINQLNTSGFVHEEFPNDENNAEGITLGYSLTKFVSEKLIKQAISRGIPCIVIRYPSVVGNSQTGYFNVGLDFVTNLFLISLRLGIIFDNEGGWSFLSADIASELTMDLLFNDNVDSEMYNLIQPNSIKVKQLMKIVDDLGYNLTVVGEDEFLEKLQQEGNNGVLSLLKDNYGSEFLTEMFDANNFISKHFLAGSLTDSQLSQKLIKAVPKVSERIGSSNHGVKMCLSYAKTTGILKELGILPAKSVKT